MDPAAYREPHIYCTGASPRCRRPGEKEKDDDDVQQGLGCVFGQLGASLEGLVGCRGRLGSAFGGSRGGLGEAGGSLGRPRCGQGGPERHQGASREPKNQKVDLQGGPQRSPGEPEKAKRTPKSAKRRPKGCPGAPRATSRQAPKEENQRQDERGSKNANI